eukprot:CAMPEP_0198698896 /NCGR_PEP_ID=MMETSP1468-20131203/345096_1 /TAXON_ID=1461545 /ORGANISM="Mantoniella sp, Strain CCMP1436" /LENGTH=35 /DNA_ID= /DNA_START= /DNA_END= /DNA_ORIENTATION=
MILPTNLDWLGSMIVTALHSQLICESFVLLHDEHA